MSHARSGRPVALHILLWLEQSSHAISPQCLQWCRRKKNENFFVHKLHCGPSLFGFHAIPYFSPRLSSEENPVEAFGFQKDPCL
jgi:hypothetical protein